MRLSTSSILASLFVSYPSHLVSAASNPTAGAVYSITNQPSGNYIISADIGSNGTLTFANAVSARGRGVHSFPVDFLDPLNSQGSIRVSSTGNLLATVNSGSDTVVVFAIDPETPSNINMIGSPVPSGGEFPISIAFAKSGNKVCVLNGGKVNGVNCYSVDQKRGLTPIAKSLRLLGLNQTTPTTVFGNTTNSIIFSEDGTKLIVSVTSDSSQTPSFLATWDVRSDGSLSPSYTKSTLSVLGLAPFGMSIIPGADAILVVDPTVGFDIFAYHGDSATSTTTAIPGQQAACWVSHSSRTGNFYFSDPSRNALFEVHVDGNLKGSVVQEYPLANNSIPLDSDVAAVAQQDFLYVLSPGIQTIEVFVASAPGKLERLQSFDYSAGAKRAGVVFDMLNSQGMAAYAKPV